MKKIFFKRMASILLSCIIVFGSISVSFATSTTRPIEKTLDVDDAWQKNKSEFTYESEALSITAPLKGKEAMEVKGYSFSYDFVIPKEFQNSKARNIAEDIIEYSNAKNDSKLEIKLGNFEIEKYAGANFTEIATAYSTTNSEVDTLEYKYNLPQGYSLKVDSLDADAVYIVNENGEEVTTITDFAVVDAAGQLLETYAEIEDNTIIQHYVTNENTVFPIVVMAVSHPDTYMSRYYNSDDIASIMYNYSQTSTFEDIAQELLTKGMVIAGQPIVTAVFEGIFWKGRHYATNQISFWYDVYLSLTDKKPYAKLTWKLKWHKGQRSYYPVGDPTMEIVSEIGA